MSSIGRDLELTLQAAHREAVSRRHAYLTVEHLLYALIHSEDGARILHHSGADVNRLQLEIERFFDEDLEAVPGDEPIETMQTLAFHRVIQNALDHSDSAEKEEVEIADLIVALFQEPDAHSMTLLRAQGVSRLDLLRYISHGESKQGESGGESIGGGAAPLLGGEESEGVPPDPLAAFTTNLTERAAAGELDPLIGRGAELDRAIHILARRRKNNPIFVGETGVGKTALAEGLALRVHEGRVPEDLERTEIFSLDLGALFAGTRYRGDFEARFKALLGALKDRERFILFIDEIHTILGAGSAQGTTVDASNLLKPGLADGTLRCMGSTTYQEYRHFERDRALSRRFQKIDIEEPSAKECVRILQGLAPRYEAHHGVRFTGPALKACVDLAIRHINDRFLPDKAIDVMDEAGATVRLRPTGKKRRTVGVRDVERVVSSMARVPVETSTSKDAERLERLESDLKAVVFGQASAVKAVAIAVNRAPAGLSGTARPTGSFLFACPSWVRQPALSSPLPKTLR
ncbi:MAG: AAA family ATPase, partial [Proteobacteria bacterium]|nr:AAA family ATPase [Pseudomonadota bacterium]